MLKQLSANQPKEVLGCWNACKIRRTGLVYLFYHCTCCMQEASWLRDIRAASTSCVDTCLRPAYTMAAEPLRGLQHAYLYGTSDVLRNADRIRAGIGSGLTPEVQVQADSCFVQVKQAYDTGNVGFSLIGLGLCPAYTRNALPCCLNDDPFGSLAKCLT